MGIFRRRPSFQEYVSRRVEELMSDGLPGISHPLRSARMAALKTISYNSNEDPDIISEAIAYAISAKNNMDGGYGNLGTEIDNLHYYLSHFLDKERPQSLERALKHSKKILKTIRPKRE